MRVVALKFANGDVGRMQFAAEASNEEVQAAIDKTHYEEGEVVAWREATLNEFAADRAEWADMVI